MENSIKENCHNWSYYANHSRVILGTELVYEYFICSECGNIKEVKRGTILKDD